MTDPDYTFSCDCKGTFHEPPCSHATYTTYTPNPVEEDRERLHRKLDRIIKLLEEIAGRRR